MCVWSAYTGKSQAAPLIFDSLKKIEGIWAGYYTGLVTCHENKLYMGKVLGNSDIWSEKFKLSDFPGCCGMIHSRTNSGGDERWGHPFMGSSGKVAVISQGCYGIFQDTANTVMEKWGNEMLENGKKFQSSIYDQPERYPVLKDGGQVHCAEVFVQAVEYWYEKLHDPLAALKKVSVELVIEDASFFLFADRPGVIAFVNSNQHVVYQQNSDGVYLSITTLGLPGRCGMELPCNSIGLITQESFQFERLDKRYETIMELPEKMLKRSLDFIQANPGCSLANVADHVLKPLFPENTLNYRVGSAYRVLEQLVLEKRVRMEKVATVSFMGSSGTEFRLFAVEEE